MKTEKLLNSFQDITEISGLVWCTAAGLGLLAIAAVARMIQNWNSREFLNQSLKGGKK